MNDQINSKSSVRTGVHTGIKEQSKLKKVWTIRKYQSDDAFRNGEEPFEVSQFEGNVLLNEGIAVLLSLLIGGAGTVFSEANSSIGVGDTDTAEDASHTGLQAPTNKAYVAVEAGYPSISGQTITWRAIFDGDTANFNWREFTVANGGDDSATNLNRKVSDQGTKASGQTWTLDLAITFS